MNAQVIYRIVLIVSATVALLNVIVVTYGDDDVTWFANATLPALLGIVLASMAIILVKQQHILAWSPVPWFWLACAFYYGFGPLVYIYGNAESVAFSDSFYPVDQFGLHRTNVLDVAGIFCATLGAIFSDWFARRIRLSTRLHQPSVIEVHRIMSVFLAFGIPINFMIAFPSKIGLLSWTPPSMLVYLAILVPLSIIPLLWLLNATGERRYQLILYAVIGSELVLGLATLSKAEVLKIILIYGLGKFLIRPKFKKVVIGGLLIGVFYVLVLSPFVTYARIAIDANSSQNAKDFLTSIGSFSESGRDDLSDILPGVQGWWTRFSYANAQLFAMDSNDRGTPGNTFDRSLEMLIPRFLYADKGQMTPGKEFTILVTGNTLTESYTSPGAFGEGYWNFGWLGVVLVGLAMGTFLGTMGIVNARLMTEGRFLYLPIIWFAIFTGTRPDDWFVLSYIGGIPQAIVLFFCIKFVEPYFWRGRIAAVST